MGFWDFLRRQPIGAMTPNVEYYGSAEEVLTALGVSDSLQGMTVSDLWRTQPHLRTVVSFVARNIAQLGLHSFERVGETDRARDRSSALARALQRTDGSTTTYELIYGLVGDLLLYDRAYWWVAPSTAVPGSEWMIRRLPPSWVTPNRTDPFTVASYRVAIGDNWRDVPAANVLAFTGYNPRSVTVGSPTVEALRETLSEQIEAAKYRGQVWKRGGRVSAVLERPANAPQWSDGAREAFREDWYAKYTGNGSKAGGTPILEDGMTLNRVDFSAQEQQFVEAAKLSLSTVAAAFHVNPTMIGVLDNANYSNVREFRKMLYGDTLGPTIAQIEQRLNAFLLPMLGVDEERFYVEFNIAEKLQGNFEEQTAAMMASTGAPWMTRNEARARVNLPAIDGGDALVVPLNVLTGGQASPSDSGSQNRSSGPARRVKAAPTDPERKKAEQVLSAFFKRQRAVVLSALGAKAGGDWWDLERWNRELADDLLALSSTMTERAAKRAIEKAGGDPDTFDMAQVMAYLKAKAEGVAESVNATTKAQLDAALEDEEADPTDVFDVAETSRSAAAAATLTTALASFGTVEAGKQSGAATKTWITGPNARASHAAMNGETVPLSENFSNGMAWPGDASDADEVAGCNCSVQFDYP